MRAACVASIKLICNFLEANTIGPPLTAPGCEKRIIGKTCESFRDNTTTTTPGNQPRWDSSTCTPPIDDCVDVNFIINVCLSFRSILNY